MAENGNELAISSGIGCVRDSDDGSDIYNAIPEDYVLFPFQKVLSPSFSGKFFSKQFILLNKQHEDLHKVSNEDPVLQRHTSDTSSM